MSSCAQQLKNLSSYSPDMAAEQETIFTPKMAFDRDLATLDRNIGRFLTSDLTYCTYYTDAFDHLLDSSETFDRLMADTGFEEYLIPLQQADLETFVAMETDDDSVENGDNDDGSDHKVEMAAPVVKDYTSSGIQATVRAQFEKRIQEIKERKEEQMDINVFQRHFFEYRRFLARPRHLRLSKDVIRRKIMDFAFLRYTLCENDDVSDAWAFVIANYMDEMGPDLFFLSECYTAVDGMLDAFEKFTFFGI